MTREQERAKARRRHQKLEARAAERARIAARNRQVGIVVAAVLVVVLGLVFLTSALKNHGAPAVAASSAPSSGATAKAPPSSTGPADIEGCATPPPAPTTIKTSKLPDKRTAAGKHFVAVVTTNCGRITLALDGAKAPQTVASFVALAKSGYFAASPCHRLTTAGIYVLQCGDPLGGRGSGPGYSYGIENAPKDGRYPAGTVAMARTSDPHSNADQFFIVYKDSTLPTDGGGYTIFGTVTAGLDMVKEIAAAGASGGTGDGAPNAPISILSVAVTQKKA